MTPGEYEDYVEEAVRQFDFWEKATVTRNKRFPGVRQPGNYEVDIAFHLNLTELVSFLLIVECKNHGRPVTRPVVQQLAQTRDAINAQKAAVVSPRGFTKEAIEVAESLGIALWVIAKDVPTQVVMAYEGLKILNLSQAFYVLRAGYLGAFGVEAAADRPPLSMVNADPDVLRDPASAEGAVAKSPEAGDTKSLGYFQRGVRGGSAFFSYESHPMFDPSCAPLQIFNDVLASGGDALFADSEISARLDRWRQDSVARFTDPAIADKALAYVATNDWPAFYALF